MNSLELFGRCVCCFIFSSIICSAALWINFVNRYNSIEREKILTNISWWGKLRFAYMKEITLQCGRCAKISYVILRISQIFIVLTCVIFLWNDSFQLWSTAEIICISYVIIVLFINSPLILSGESPADTTDRDMKLEYISACERFKILQKNGETNLKDLKQCALQMQTAGYQYYRWLYCQRGADYSAQAETEIQFLRNSFQKVEEQMKNASQVSFESSFCIKNMFFVPTKVYAEEFKNQERQDNIDRALRILDLFIERIGKVHDWNTDIGRNDLAELYENCELWFALTDEAEQYILYHTETERFQRLLEIYGNACMSLMTAPEDLRQKMKRKKQRWKQ